MNPWVQTIVTVVSSVLASSGLWAFFTSAMQARDRAELEKDESERALANMVRGLAHAKIVEIGTRFLEQGYVTLDDLNEFDHYLYQPYEALGGNGYAKKIYEQVMKLDVIVEDHHTERKQHD